MKDESRTRTGPLVSDKTPGVPDDLLHEVERLPKHFRDHRPVIQPPAHHHFCGEEVCKIVVSTARLLSSKIVLEGAWAANLLGLSTQVPAKIIYLTDGRTNEVLIGLGVTPLILETPRPSL